MPINGGKFYIRAHVVEHRLLNDMIIGVDALHHGKAKFDLSDNILTWYDQEFRLDNTKLIPYSLVASISESIEIPEAPTASLQNILREYEEIFMDIGGTPNKEMVPECSFILKGPPVKQKPYRQELRKREEVERQVEDMLQKGIIRASHSPFGSPLCLVPKKDGTQRLQNTQTAMKVAKQVTQEVRERNKKRIDAKATNRIIEEGDHVTLLVNEPLTFASKRDPLWIVTKVRGQVVTIQHQPTGQVKVVNKEKLKVVDPNIKWEELRPRPRRPRLNRNWRAPEPQYGGGNVSSFPNQETQSRDNPTPPNPVAISDSDKESPSPHGSDNSRCCPDLQDLPELPPDSEHEDDDIPIPDVEMVPPSRKREHSPVTTTSGRHVRPKKNDDFFYY